MEKQLIVISNAVNTYKANNLSRFENKVTPAYLPSHLEWQASIHTIGFDFKPRNKATPDDPKFPSFLQITKKYLKPGKYVSCDENGCLAKVSLKAFEPWHMFFLESDESYSPARLNFIFRWKLLHYQRFKPSYFSGFPTKLSNGTILFGQFESNLDLSDKDNLNYLFFHPKFFDAIDIGSSDDFGKVWIDNEMYYVKYSKTPLKSRSFCQGLKIEIPKMIQICSSSIDQESYNVKNIMRRFSVTEKDVGTYITKVFKNQTFFEISKDLTSFKINLCDESGEILVLNTGTPTYVKIQLSPKEMSHFPLYLRSDNIDTRGFENKPFKFNCPLPGTIDFNVGHWKVALQSISYINTLQMLDEPFFVFYSEDRSLEDKNRIKHMVPKNIKSLQKVTDFFFNELKHIVTHEITKHGVIKLEFLKDARIIIAKDLAIVLGGERLVGDDTYVLDIVGSPGTPFLFEKKPRFLPIFAQSLYLYSDICEETIVGETHSKLLKIVPLSHSNLNERVTYESVEMEYLELSRKEISCISFEIRTHTGKLFSFEQNDTIFVDLVFKKY